MHLPYQASQLRSNLETWITTPVTDARVRILAAELNRDPIGVVKQFQCLHAEANDVFVDFSEKAPFTRFVWKLGQAIKYLINEDHEKAIPLVVDADIVEAYIAVVQTKNFFSVWPVTWRAVIFEVLAVVVTFARSDHTARERICRTTEDLFSWIWDCRSIVRLSDPGVQHTGYSIDDTTMLPTVMDAYYDVYEESNRVPEPETRIHHVHVLTWILSREEVEVRPICLHQLLFTSFYSAWGPELTGMREAGTTNVSDKSIANARKYSEVRDQFAKACIVDGIGGYRMIDAVEVELRKILAHKSTCDCENHTEDIRYLAKHLLDGPVLSPLIFERDLLGYSLQMLRELFATGSSDPMCTNLCLFCVNIAMHYDMYHLTARVKLAMPYQYPDIVDLFVAGVELAAGGCNLTATDGDLQGAITIMLEFAAERIQRDIDERGGKLPEYISSLKLRAAPHWYPSLRRLQLAVPLIEKEALSKVIPVADLIDRWAAFGSIIGLDAAEERKRHDHGKEEHCHWRSCRRQTNDVGVTDLRKCAGCGEVRYCSKDCQKLDWKEGGHKRACRRLK